MLNFYMGGDLTDKRAKLTAYPCSRHGLPLSLNQYSHMEEATATR